MSCNNEICPRCFLKFLEDKWKMLIGALKNAKLSIFKYSQLKRTLYSFLFCLFQKANLRRKNIWQPTVFDSSICSRLGKCMRNFICSDVLI